MYNERIRAEAKSNRVKLWQIAEKLGIPDFAFSRKLRRELPETDQSKILEIIRCIAKENENAEDCTAE